MFARKPAPSVPCPAVERPRFRADIEASIPELAHLQALGAAVPVEVLSDDAYVALLLIASAWEHGKPRVCVDAYEVTRDEWRIEIHAPHGVPYDAEFDPRFSPAGWDVFVQRFLLAWVRQGFMPLCDIWCEVCRELAIARTGSLLIPEQWAESAPAQGGAE